jgi:hypothetical protein
MKDISELAEEARRKFYNDLAVAIAMTAESEDVAPFGYIVSISNGPDTERLTNAKKEDADSVLIAIADKLRGRETSHISTTLDDRLLMLQAVHEKQVTLDSGTASVILGVSVGRVNLAASELKAKGLIKDK